jgi:uncharacterized protein
VAALLDTNVLLALAWPTHFHHAAARRWFGERSAGGWATCPITHGGFVRASSNKAAIPDAVTPPEAVEVLRRITSLAGHEFWHDDVAITDLEHAPLRMLVGYRQVTDFYLLGLVARREGRLVTFDRGVLSLVPPNSRLRSSIDLLVP